MTEERPDAADEAEGTPPPAATGLEVVGLEDFESADLEAPLADARSVCCAKLAGAYRDAATAATAEGKDREARVYGLLASVMQMHFKPEDRSEPYGPMFVFEDRRGVIPDDLRGEQSRVFADIAPRLKNPGLRALLSDIAWINDRRRAESAQLAIGSFSEAVRLVAEGKAESYFDDGRAASHEAAEVLRRACQIASATGWKEPEAGALRALIASMTNVAADGGDADGYLSLGTLNADYGVSALADIASRAEVLAQTDGLFPETLRHLWELAARAHRLERKDAESNRCLVMAAECYVSMAAATGFKGIVAASWLMNAIEALRRIPGTKERREELRAKLREAQASISDEMGVISTELDVSAIVDHARKSVQGLTFARALAEFAQLDASPESDALRKEALEQAGKYPLSSMMPMAMHDGEGKLVAKSPGLFGGVEVGDEGLRHLIARHESFRRDLTVTGAIEPARRLINAEHPLHVRHLRPLAEMSPFVPAGHEEFFALGFARFFGGDVISALHILVPQLENSLRYVLKQAAVDPSSIKNDMTQTNRTLSVMLEKDRATLEAIFGPAIVLEIENLFDFDGGPALRHQLAHGLLSAAACRHGDAIYACWFVFRLCVLPLFPHWEHIAEVYAGL